MQDGTQSSAATLTACALAILSSLVMASAAPAAEPMPAPPSAREQAPYDLSGYWVSLVTTDWRMRMVVPGKGEYGGVPLNMVAKQTADAFDPAIDEAAGTTCKAYGVGGLMRIPGRIHITWQDDNTLKVEMDAGRQTRLLRFAPSTADLASAPGLQGVSIAKWELPSVVGYFAAGGDTPVRGIVPANDGAGMFSPPSPPGMPKSKFGTLKVTTSKASPGYLRKNGLPYGSAMTMTEYWELRVTSSGTQILSISTELDDPQYLQSPYAFAPNFKKEPDGSKWNPTDCSLRW